MNFIKIILVTFLTCFYLPLQALQFYNDKHSVPDVADKFPAFGKITNFTGTLIDSSWVLTCEHCGGHEGTELKINEETYKVDKRIPHPLRSHGHGTDSYDLALLHLEKPVTNLNPVRRYRGTLDDLVGKVAWVLGRTSQGRSPNLEAGTSFLKISDFDSADFLTRDPDHTQYEANQIPGDSGSAVFMNLQNPMSQIPPQNEIDFYQHFGLIGIYTGYSGSDPLIASLCRPSVNNWIDNTIIAWALGKKEEAGKWVISLSKPKLEDAPSGLLGIAADIGGTHTIVALIDSRWLLANSPNASYYGTIFETGFSK